MPAARPILFLSDFGESDAYAGIVRAVLLARCPAAPVVDLTHGVPPGNLLWGALLLASAVPYAPADAIFLAVVDPGVGGPRRPVCIRSGAHLFVGPDNGLLWLAAAACGSPEGFLLDRPEHWLPAPGSTFHGRDLFGPVAAALAGGLAPEAAGSPVTDLVRLEPPPCRRLPGGAEGEVLLVDRFGNAVTNLSPADLGHPAPGSLEFELAGRAVRGPSEFYGSVPAGEPLVVLGSMGRYEVAVHRASASEVLGLGPGDAVRAWSPRPAAPS